MTATTTDANYDLDLRREGETWYVDGEPRADLAGGALDCDLACSPVTNTMPIFRHGLQHGPGAQRFLMAFVQVPTLRVVTSQQSYTHLSLAEDTARVRYASGSFVSDLTVDRDGLVIEYPTMASRIPAVTPVTAEQRIGGPGAAPDRAPTDPRVCSGPSRGSETAPWAGDR